MRLGDWILTLQEDIYSWVNKLPRTGWILPVRFLGHLLLFVIFQMTNLVAQLRWPFSAVIRLITSFQPPAPDRPIPVNEVKLLKLLDQDLPVLVDYWTEWCGPCIAMEGSVKEFAKSYEGKVIVVKVDATINPRLTKKFHVMGYPTLLLFVRGEEVSRYVGALNYKWLVEFVEHGLSKSPS
jgi:thioredoxin 1